MNGWAYRAPLLTMMGPPLLMIALVWLVPESPRYLVTRDRNEKARTNLRKIRGESYTDAEIDAEIEATIKFTALERQIDASASYLDCFKGNDRRRTLIAIMMMVGQQFMGVAFLAGYMTYFFALVGFTDAFIVSVITNAVAIAGTFAAFPIVRYCGRRRTMITGAFVNSFCLLAFASINEAHPGSPAAAKCLIAFICIFSFTYSATWGSIGPIVIGEVPSNARRSKTVSIALGASFLVALTVITSIPYLIGPTYLNLGTKIGFVFGGLTVLVTIGTIFFLPETRDRTLEEIDEMFLNVSLSRLLISFAVY
jgi:MFS transporter, SP family, sugar:H+ symporter